jgi:hypothetical protein
MLKIIFLLQLFCTLFMTGLIWFVQIVHYPLFNQIAPACFANYETIHCQVTTSVVALPMILEAFTAGLMPLVRPGKVSALAAWSGLALVIIIWFSTLFFSIPNHSILSSGFNQKAYDELCNLNWIRTICWTLRSLLLLSLVYRMIPLALDDHTVLGAKSRSPSGAGSKA